MATATLTLSVPGRRPASANRTPRYVSPYTSRVDVSAVVAGAPSPWPIATSTSIPTPGPVASGATPTPIPVTMTVPVAVGNAQFSVNTYDSGGYLLSGITSGTVPILANSANAVNLVLNAAANCVAINHAGGGAFKMTPLINQASAQTATFLVTPCDADGYPIPAGQNLSNAIVFATPAPASITVNSNQRRPQAALPTATPSPTPAPLFSPAVITAGGDTLVTVTYPAGSNAVITQQAVPSPMPSAVAYIGSITLDPVYYTYVTNRDDGTVSVFLKDLQGTIPVQALGTVSLGAPVPGALYPSAIAAGGPADYHCAAGGQALIPGNGYLSVLTQPVPNQTNPTPLPAANTFSNINASQATSAALDSACQGYVGDSTGHMYTISGGLTTSSLSGSSYYTTSTGNPGFTSPVTAVGWLNGTAYVGLGQNSGYFNNIVDILNNDTGAGLNTILMAPYNSSSMAIVYQPSVGPSPPPGDYSVAQVSQSGSKLLAGMQATLSGSYYAPPKGIAVDTSGNVWIAGGSYLYQAIPSGGTFIVRKYSLPAPNYNASSIAAAPDGTLFITDTGSSPGTMYTYSWTNITGGIGVTPLMLNSYTVGKNPSGIAIAP